MKTLLVFYSRTGTTKRAAEELTVLLGADQEEIIDKHSRQGVMGYLRSGWEAILKKAAEIEPPKKNPADYDLIIIGTPVWAETVSSPVRAYLSNYRTVIKRVAFFCTFGGSGSEKTFKEMEEILGRKPLACLSLLTKEVKEGKFIEKMKNFSLSLKA